MITMNRNTILTNSFPLFNDILAPIILPVTFDTAIKIASSRTKFPLLIKTESAPIFVMQLITFA